MLVYDQMNIQLFTFARFIGDAFLSKEQHTNQNIHSSFPCSGLSLLAKQTKLNSVGSRNVCSNFPIGDKLELIFA